MQLQVSTKTCGISQKRKKETTTMRLTISQRPQAMRIESKVLLQPSLPPSPSQSIFLPPTIAHSDFIYEYLWHPMTYPNKEYKFILLVRFCTISFKTMNLAHNTCPLRYFHQHQTCPTTGKPCNIGATTVPYA
jgi:hypothetical protein